MLGFGKSLITRGNFRSGLQIWARAEPLTPILAEVARAFVIGCSEPREVNPGNVGPAMMGLIKLAMQKNPTHEPIVAQVPCALDDVAFAEGVADVLAG